MPEQDEFARRKSHLIAVVEQELPDFARVCRDDGADIVLMHHAYDALAILRSLFSRTAPSSCV